MNSPLGQYAQPVAALVVIVTIGAWIGAVLTGNAEASQIFPFATLAFGAVLGSASAINGYKQPLATMQDQLNAHLAAQPDLPALATTVGVAAASAIKASQPVA